MNKIVLATNNRGKIEEITQILSLKGVHLLSLKDINFTETITEDGTTYKENAKKKAETVYNFCRIPVIADDSGIEVNALKGEPGIFSARFAGDRANDRDNNNLLLQRLSEVQIINREAQFVCVAIFYYAPEKYVFTSGTVKGIILSEPRGSGGFGYDPLFFLPELQKTMAELSPEEKNRISHRAMAFRALKPYIEKYLF